MYWQILFLFIHSSLVFVSIGSALLSTCTSLGDRSSRKNARSTKGGEIQSGRMELNADGTQRYKGNFRVGKRRPNMMTSSLEGNEGEELSELELSDVVAAKVEKSERVSIHGDLLQNSSLDPERTTPLETQNLTQGRTLAMPPTDSAQQPTDAIAAGPYKVRKTTMIKIPMLESLAPVTSQIEKPAPSKPVKPVKAIDREPLQLVSARSDKHSENVNTAKSTYKSDYKPALKTSALQKPQARSPSTNIVLNLTLHTQKPSTTKLGDQLLTTPLPGSSERVVEGSKTQLFDEDLTQNHSSPTTSQNVTSTSNLVSSSSNKKKGAQ